MDALYPKTGITKPPVASNTRWAGMIPVFKWLGKNATALVEYNENPEEDCAANDDGTTYQHHSMCESELEVVAEVVCSLLLLLIWLHVLS